MSIRNNVLSVCNQHLGIGEPKGDDKFIQWFNENVLKTWNLNMNVAWCHIFAAYSAVHGGLTGEEFPLTASCDVGMNWFKVRKQWKDGMAYGGNYIPKRGDVIYYSSSHNQYDSTHVGWVESCDGTLLTAIEGNYSNKVKKRTIYLSNPYILGYGLVKFPDEKHEDLVSSNSLVGTGIGVGVALETMNVRIEPTTSQPSVGKLLKGKSVEILAVTENNWLKVVWGTAEKGYAYISNTKPYFNIMCEEESYKPMTSSHKVGDVVQFKGTKHYTSTNAEKRKICKSGKAKITQIAVGSKHPYHLIATEDSASNVYGWVDESDITSLAQSGYTPWVGKVTASILNVRTEPMRDCSKLQAWPQLKNGNLVDVLGEVIGADKKIWYYVNIQGNKGYVHSAYVEKA